MTNRVVFGIDPGVSGAVSVFLDGEGTDVTDLPIMARAAGGNLINGSELANRLRIIRQLHPGAAFVAYLEQVHAMRGQGVTSTFNFGESYGTIKGVLQALGIAIHSVRPQAWKKSFGLSGADKDASRTLAIERFPALASQLTRKKDGGRGESLLIGLYGVGQS